ncbi:MAG TPA: MMPL family transporter [Aliidongia sp.]|nr:MMPL family transporter [Aliidongia sp.]
MKENAILHGVRTLENVVFGARRLIIGLFVLATIFFAWEATHLKLDAGLAKLVPAGHPFIQTQDKYGKLFGGGNPLLIAIQNKNGSIFTPDFFDTLKKVNDEVFYLPGVDRSSLVSLFSPNVIVIEISEEGLHGEPVIPKDFKPTAEGFEHVKANILKGRGLFGRLVSSDFTTAVVAVRLLEHDPRTGARLDYIDLAHRIEADVKQKYEAANPNVDIHIVGFARAVGEIADGAKYVVLFFGIALAITAFLLYRVSHHWWLMLAPLICSLSAVIWQLGLITMFGYGIDVLSVLIPFLIMSIGVSHGVQMILSTGQLAAAGQDTYHAARHSFRRLFLPGAVALITGVITFLTITTIKIPVIRELAATATIGIGALAFTNLIWLPLMVSYAKINERTIRRMQTALDRREKFWHLLAILVQPRYAVVLSIGAIIIAFGAYMEAQNLVVGDLNRGRPELRPNSRYNQDTAFVADHFGLSTDTLAIYATGPADACLTKANIQAVDEFVGAMRFVPGVHGTDAESSFMKSTTMVVNEGDIRWKVLSHDSHVLGEATGGDIGSGMSNPDCSVMLVNLFLEDHKAATIASVVQAAESYIANHPNPVMHFELAGGSAGVDAATNDAVDAAQIPMMVLVYTAVILICAVTFRSVRAVICIIVPLGLVSLIANAAMALLGIGLKTATLPVAALGVGIGVDYGIYKFSRLSHYMSTGMSLQDAYVQTLRETGSAVIFTGLTLSVGVATWVFSPLQFQADMGLLLTLMFFMNMVGAIILLPALIGVMQIIKPQRAEDMARSSMLHQH